MLEIKWIVAEPKAFDAAMKRRGLASGAVPSGQEFAALNAERLELIKRVETLRGERNRLAKEVAAAKRGGTATADAEKRAIELKRELAVAEDKRRLVGQSLNEKLLTVPNRLADEVKDGAEPSVLKQGGSKPKLANPKDHTAIGQSLGLMDFAAAAKMSAARFVVLKGQLARLERALAEFMLAHNVGEFGYEEVSPPLLVNGDALVATAQLPKFGDELFAVEGKRFWLIPTAEVPLTNLAREKTFKAEELPRRYTSLTPCFRSEAGAAGKDTKGMMRQHQFYKVELVSITDSARAGDELERMTECAESLLDKLGLCWRRVILGAEDTGFAARKTYDLEVWCAGQGQFREISSCSDCGTFQAMRMGARIRDGSANGGFANGGFANTLNGSALAVGRALLAILEHYQTENGEVVIPEVLRRYMDGEKKICRKS